MACEKYAGWMTDAALESLAPERRKEFLSHIAACPACRKSFDEQRSLLEAMNRGIESLATREPPAHFEARLRARLAAEASPTGVGRFSWVPIGVAALAVVVAAAIVTIKMSGGRSHAGSAPQVAATDAAKKLTPTPGISAPGAVLPIRSNADRQNVHRPTNAVNTHARAAKSFATREKQPEVLVQPGQFALVRQFAAGLRDGSINGQQILNLEQQSEAPLDVKPIQIAPLEIPELQADDSDDSTGGPAQSSVGSS